MLLREDISADEAFAEAARGRREDLLVHMALQQFPGSPKYRSLPRSIQADIKAFFGSQATALLEARRLLFAAGDRAAIRADAEAAVAAGLGGLRGTLPSSGSYRRRYPGCRPACGCSSVAPRCCREESPVAISSTSTWRLLAWPCSSATTWRNPIPFVTERVKVDLGRLKVFADRREPETTPVYFKSSFLPGNQPVPERQIEFETALAATGLFEGDAPEPRWSDVNAALRGFDGART